MSATATEQFNPRFAAYARAHGRSPEEQLVQDRIDYPGGVMAGFILWMSARKREFVITHPEACIGSGKGHVTDQIVDYDAWDRFLEEAAILGSSLSKST